jgi:hypothetical protein
VIAEHLGHRLVAGTDAVLLEEARSHDLVSRGTVSETVIDGLRSLTWLVRRSCGGPSGGPAQAGQDSAAHVQLSTDFADP